MFASVELIEPQKVWTRPAVKPLDEGVWQAWLGKGRAQDRCRSAALIEGVKWVPLPGLLAMAGQWAHPGAYDVVVRFVVAACTLAMIFQALHPSFHVVAAVFGAQVVLYNPLVPTFGFSGERQSAVVVASTRPPRRVARLAQGKDGTGCLSLR